MLDAHRLKFDIVEDVIKRYAKSDEGVENLRLAYEEPIDGYQSIKWGGAVNDFKEGVVEGDETPFITAIWKYLHYGVGARIGRRYTAIPISKKVKAYMIRSWYDGVEKIMKQGGLEMIEDMLSDIGEEYKSWDEISMNQFEVQLMGVSNDLYGENIEDLGQQNSIPVDHMYVSSKGTRFDEVIQSRVGVYYAQVRQQTPDAIRLLIESRTEMPESKNSGVAVDMMEFLLAGKVGDDAELKDILFGFAGGVYKVPYWEKGVSGTTNDWAPYVDCPVIGDSFDEGDLVNPLMYDELNVQDGAYINSHRSNGYNPANSVLVDGLAVFADLCDGRYTNYEGIAWIWFENTAMMKDRTAAGVAVGIIFGIFGKDNGWKIAQRAAEKMREHYDDFPYVPVQYLE
jgi:hypothetical protein